MKRAFEIFIKALLGIHSPSLGRKVRFTDVFADYGKEHKKNRRANGETD